MKVTLNHGGHFYTSRGGCLTRLVVLSIAVMVGAWLLPHFGIGIAVETSGAVILTAIVISILNNTLRPILIVIALPSNPVILNLLLFAINVLIILLASELVSGFSVDGIGAAALLSLVIMAVNFLLELPNRILNRKTLDNSASQSPSYSNDNTDDEGFTPYEEIEN